MGGLARLNVAYHQTTPVPGPLTPRIVKQLNDPRGAVPQLLDGADRPLILLQLLKVPAHERAWSSPLADIPFSGNFAIHDGDCIALLDDVGSFK
ncbi:MULTISPECIES: hypothetical protein [unclassified Rhizobium]|uniref:hypothetical protein n=1 Tax=unclassified Rhizobium TaxID=2613769 RepID=UPI001FFDF83C|nr:MULTISPECIES: hypothetical protein [unclassified Rhizobium]